MLQAGIAAKTCGVDVLGYTNAKGAGIKKAFELLAPYAKGEKSWPYKQISGFDKSKISGVLPAAQFEYNDNFGLSADQVRSLDPDDTIQLAYPLK